MSHQGRQRLNERQAKDRGEKHGESQSPPSLAIPVSTQGVFPFASAICGSILRGPISLSFGIHAIWMISRRARHLRGSDFRGGLISAKPLLENDEAEQYLVIVPRPGGMFILQLRDGREIEVFEHERLPVRQVAAHLS